MPPVRLPLPAPGDRTNPLPWPSLPTTYSAEPPGLRLGYLVTKTTGISNCPSPGTVCPRFRHQKFTIVFPCSVAPVKQRSFPACSLAPKAGNKPGPAEAFRESFPGSGLRQAQTRGGWSSSAPRTSGKRRVWSRSSRTSLSVWLATAPANPSNKAARELPRAACFARLGLSPSAPLRFAC